MTCKQKPPIMTHQPGLPADSASRAKPGGSPEDQPTSLFDSLVRCNVNDGPWPKKGDLVWMWFAFAERWQMYTVLDQQQHPLGGPEYEILNTETGQGRWVRYNRLHMPK